MARAMPSSSSASAVRVGVSSPLELRWLRVREVLKPMAPASTAWRARAGHRLDVLGRGHLALGAALAHDVEAQRRRGARGWRGRRRSDAPSSASRNSGNDCQFHGRPSWRAAPGMSSTPSISWISRSWSAGRTGAKPTPQLPATTVVTPCQADGMQARVPGGLAVVVHVDVDEAGRDEQAVGVELLGGGAVHLPHLGDDAVGDGDVGGAGGGAGAVEHRPTSDDQVVCWHRSPRTLAWLRR